MAMTVDELEVLIKANTSSLEKGLKNVERQLGSFGKSTTKASKGISTFAIAAGNIIANVAGKAFSALSSNVDSAINRLDTLNNYTKVMSNLGIGAEDAQASINKMQDVLTGLPTKLDDAALSVQRLTSANGNIQASTDMFLALNDAILAGGASSDIQSSAIEQLSQAYSKGKPDAMEWRTMLMAMPAQLKQVANSMGYVSTSVGGDLYEAIQTGKISMDDFMLQIVKLDKEGYAGFKSFSEQAKASTAGVETALTNLKTAITKAMTQIMDVIGQTNISGFINGIGSAIATVANYIAAFIMVIKQAVAWIGALFGGSGSTESMVQETESASEAMGAVANSAEDTAGGISDANKQAKKLKGTLAGFDEMNVLTEKDSSGSGSGSGGGAGGVGAGLKDYKWDSDIEKGASKVEEIFNRIKNALGSLDLSQWRDAILNFGIGFQNVLDISKSAFGSFINDFIIPVARNAFEVAIPKFISKVGKAMQTLDYKSWSRGFEDFFSGLAEAVMPLTNIVAELAGDLAECVAFLANWIVPPALSVIGAILSTIGSILQGIYEGWSFVWDNVIEPSLKIFDKMLQPIIKDIQETAKRISENTALMETLKNVGMVLGETLGFVFAVVADAIGIVITVIMTAVDIVLHLIEVIISFCQNMWNVATTIFGAIGSFIGNIFNSIGVVVTAVGNVIKGVFEGAWNTLKSGAQAAFDGIKSIFSGLANFFGSIFSNAWNAVKNVFSVGGRIFDGIKDGIANAFKAIVNTLIRGINTVVAIPFNAINGFLNTIHNINILGVKPFEWVGQIGVPQIPYLAKGGIATGATLAMIGEAGKEAVLPLDHNTGWIDDLADKIADREGQQTHLVINLGTEKLLDQVITGINDLSSLNNRSVLNF